MREHKKTVGNILVVVTMLLSSMALFGIGNVYARYGESTPGKLSGRVIYSSNTHWQTVDTFDVFETVFAEARGLLSATHYEVYVVPETISPGANLAMADVSGGCERFTTNMDGELEGNVVWWYPDVTGVYKIVVDDNWNGVYDVFDLNRVITVTDLDLREIYPTDPMGILDTGFFFGESVYVRGKGFPPNTNVADVP